MALCHHQVTWFKGLLGLGDADWEGLKAEAAALVSVNTGSGTDTQDVFLFRSEVGGRKNKRNRA